MSKILAIPVQKLFVVALVLKLGSSAIGWRINDPRWFGCAIPLAVMMAYIFIGNKRLDRTVSDEKFADSCYYLGFIFTITSIIFCLVDLPHIGTQMSDIAARFGVAMVSTVLGLGARVYLVSFRENIEDAVRSAEDGVIEATHRLREQFNIALQQLREFDAQVNEATTQSIAKVSVGIEALMQAQGERLSEFFDQLAQENAQAFDKALHEVKDASERLATCVDGYSAGMRNNLQSIEGQVTKSAQAVTQKLENTTFPGDYFAAKLTAPLERLAQSTGDIATTVNGAASDMRESVDAMRVATASMRARSGELDDMLERIVQLATTQDNLLAGSQTQLATLGVLTGTLCATQESLSTLNGNVQSHKGALAACTDAVTKQAEGLVLVTNTLHALGESLKSTDSRMQALQTANSGTTSELAKLGPGLADVTQQMQTTTVALAQITAVIGRQNAGFKELSLRIADANAIAAQTHALAKGTEERIAGEAHSFATRGHSPATTATQAPSAGGITVPSSGHTNGVLVPFPASPDALGSSRDQTDN